MYRNHLEYRYLESARVETRRLNLQYYELFEAQLALVENEL
jgi:hypothetical protein